VLRRDESSDDRAVAIGSDHQIGAKVPLCGLDHGLVSVRFHSDVKDRAAGQDAHGTRGQAAATGVIGSWLIHTTLYGFCCWSCSNLTSVS
jgi:hypothetical protein